MRPTRAPLAFFRRRKNFGYGSVVYKVLLRINFFKSDAGKGRYGLSKCSWCHATAGALKEALGPLTRERMKLRLIFGAICLAKSGLDVRNFGDCVVDDTMPA